MAVTREAGTLRVFVDGTLSATVTRTTNFASSGGQLCHAAFTGYLDGFRVTKGIARYTGNFTPPNTAALPYP